MLILDQRNEGAVSIFAFLDWMHCVRKPQLTSSFWQKKKQKKKFNALIERNKNWGSSIILNLFNKT